MIKLHILALHISRFHIAGTLIALITFTLPLTGNTKSTDQSRHVAIGTGSPSGGYFVTGHSLCRAIERHSRTSPGISGNLEIIRCAALPTPGSISNLASIRTGEFSLGIVQSDWQHHAYHGTGVFEGNAFKNLRAIASLSPEAFHLLIGRDIPGASLDSLQGKNVNIGVPGSGDRGTFAVMLRTNNKDFDWFGATYSQSQSKRGDALCEGDVDAISFVIAVPSALVQNAITKCRARLISLDALIIDNMMVSNPFFGRRTIEANTYVGQLDKIRTVGVYATLVTTTRVDHHKIFDITRAIFTQLAVVKGAHPALNDLKPSAMRDVGLSAPLHDGAVLFYNSKEFENILNRKTKPTN